MFDWVLNTLLSYLSFCSFYELGSVVARWLSNSTLRYVLWSDVWIKARNKSSQTSRCRCPEKFSEKNIFLRVFPKVFLVRFSLNFSKYFFHSPAPYGCFWSNDIFAPHIQTDAQWDVRWITGWSYHRGSSKYASFCYEKWRKSSSKVYCFLKDTHREKHPQMLQKVLL